MFASFKGSVIGLVRWQWKAVALFLSSAVVVVLLDRFYDINMLRIPALPVAVVGGAIGIFASFRTNSAYDRWWEGRKLWGRLINTSRHFCTQALIYTGPVAPTLVRRHIAYVHVLRALLRTQPPLKDPDVREFLTPEEQDELSGESNMTHAILQLQAATFTKLADEGHLDERRLQSMDESIRHLLDIQGGCERIKKTPFPGGYGYILDRLIQAFGVLLPLGLVEALGWLTVPVAALTCLAFTLISEVGRVLEDPFTMFWPALPLSALSKTIEVNLRQRLGEADLPALPKPDARGILM